MPWDMFYVLLAVALDLDERESFNRYLLAHGDPKKFPWSSMDRAGTLRGKSGFWDRVFRSFGRGRKGKLEKMADHLDIPTVVAVYKKNPDGSRGEFLRYMDPKTGKSVDMKDRVFKPIKKKSQDKPAGGQG